MATSLGAREGARDAAGVGRGRRGEGRRADARAATTRRREGRRRRGLVVVNGSKYKKSDFEMERQIGEGSFGVVYEGRVAVNDARGLRKGDAVVLKRPKLTVEGAAELQEIESWMNDRVSRDAKGACAEFVGSFRVTRDDWLASGTNDALSKEGLWLVWRYQGDRTLAQYLAQPDYPTGLAKALLDRDDVYRGDAAVELEITQRAISQLLSSLMAMHRAGLVHRDVKPHNLVLAREPTPEFKVIDLGACACFRSGMNFTPDETIMDPKYAPPEEFLIPTDDAPDLRKMFAPVALAAGTTAWLSHRPDRFDMYSTGIVLMQLAMPSLRTNSGLQSFNRGLKKFKYDLQKWREANKGQLSRSKTAVLDAGDGAGWELAADLLRPRPYEAEDDQEARERPSAEQALKHRFFQVDPTELKVEVKEGRGDNWVAETAGMLTDMFSLEKRIQRQQVNIAKQSTTIQRMRDDGEDAKKIAEEEKTLEKMRVGLQGLVRSMSFKEVEARTTMVSAATELKKAAKESGVETSKEYDGLLSNLSSNGIGKTRMQSINDRVNRAAQDTRKSFDEGMNTLLRAIRPNAPDAEDEERQVSENVEREEKTTPKAPATRKTVENTKDKVSSMLARISKQTPAKEEDSEAIRLRMEAIQNEMNAVIEEMAEMESRLLAQQQELEAQQKNISTTFTPQETTESRKKNGSKKNGSVGAFFKTNGKKNGSKKNGSSSSSSSLVDANESDT
jgi:serine/threonine protein kinase